jgi:bla regulator protein blaR1
MRTLTRSIAALYLLSASLLAQAPNLSGQWQGVLAVGKDLRIVVVITTTDGLKATMFSIDQTPQGIPASAITLQGTTLRMSFTGIGVNFEGAVAADGNTVTGTFTQGNKPIAMTLARANTETAWKIPEPPKPMAADAKAVFEVATIKPSNPAAQGKLFTIKGRQVLTINTTLADVVTMAYGLHVRQIVGAPSWMESDKYDITGQPEGQGMPNQNQMRSMLRALVEDRFKLTTHRETREQSAYALVVGPGGPKLTKNDSNPNGLPSLLFRGLGVLPVNNATMADFAGVMQLAVLDRPVIDRTGLLGRFDFTLTWTPDETQFASFGVRIPSPSGAADAPPVLFTAIQEQLGLKFDSVRAPVEVMVIDRVERPSEN